MRECLCWQELVVPRALSPEAVRAVLVGLAGLPAQPRLVLETLAQAGCLRWRLGADDDLPLRRACHIITTHLPDVVVLPLRHWPALAVQHPAVAATVRASRSRLLPLGSQDPDAVTRSLLGALSRARSGEQTLMQVLLGVRTAPRQSRTTTDGDPRVLRARAAATGFGCSLRLAATAATRERAHALVSSIGGALVGVEAPGVSVRLARCSVRAITSAATPFIWPLWLSTTDLGALLGWPVSADSSAELPGMPSRHPRVLPALSAHPRQGLVIGEAVMPAHPARPIAHSLRDGLHHRHVMGPTGVGKSTLLAQIVLQGIDAGHGAVVVDPKGDLVTDLLARIPKHRQSDVVVLDAASATPVGLNPLVSRDPDLAADSVVAVFHSLFGDGLGPRSTDILHAACLTLARRGDSSLPMVPLLLTIPGFRRSVAGRAAKADPLGLGAFWASFEAMSDAERDAAVRPLLNKLRQLLLRPSLRAVFGQVRPAVTLEQILAQRKILLVRLGKDRIGPEAAQLFGSLLVAELWQAILGRLRLPVSQRHPTTVVIDEVQDYLRLPGSLGDALAQARGLGVGITAAHQHRAQLGRLADDLDANTASKCFFRLSPADARVVAGQQAAGILEPGDFTALPAFQLYARLLVTGNPTPWVLARTRPLPPPSANPSHLQSLSEARYGRALSDVERDLLALIDHPVSDRASTMPVAQPEATADQAPEPRLGRRRPPRSSAEPGAAAGEEPRHD